MLKQKIYITYNITQNKFYWDVQIIPSGLVILLQIVSSFSDGI